MMFTKKALLPLLMMHASITQATDDNLKKSSINVPTILSIVVVGGGFLCYQCIKRTPPNKPNNDLQNENAQIVPLKLNITVPVKKLFDMKKSSILQVLKRFPEVINYQDAQQRNLLHHAILRHTVPLISALLTSNQTKHLLKQKDIKGHTPQSLLGIRLNHKSLLEAAYDEHAYNLCKILINLGAGDYRPMSKAFAKESIKSFAQQKICLHEMRIRRNVQGGCLICLESIDRNEVALHDCCYTCFHQNCSRAARKHNTRCPQCRKEFNAITEKRLDEQTNFTKGLQSFFN